METFTLIARSDIMSWKAVLKEEDVIEKGIMDKLKSMINKMKDASFKKKLGKFLKRELDIKYTKEDIGLLDSKFTRTSDRKDDLEKAKNVLLQVVEEVYDATFPESYLMHWEVLDDSM